jgi:ATP-dependent 26S proteasome regulatory subunit
VDRTSDTRYVDNTDDLRLLIASRYPLIFVEEDDEARFLAILEGFASSLQLPLWIWSATRGLVRHRGDPVYGTVDVQKTFDFVGDSGRPAIIVFADGVGILENALVRRRFKEFAQSARAGQTIVVTGASATVPPELAGQAVVWRLQPPTRGELAAMVRIALADLAARRVPVTLAPEGIDALSEALKGLSLTEARRLVEQAAVRDGALAIDDVAFVREQKAEMLDTAGALEVIPSDGGSLDDIGGLDRLKDWLRLRGNAMEPAAKGFGLEPPRGILIIGVPGCGKSLIAKTLARSWEIPLVSLHVSRLYGQYVGESEQRLRDALATAEAMAPVVLWIDELEKAFPSRGEADGGVSQRILGETLRWMQERPDGTFIVATSNDVKALPPELLRKGRFDEIFFVDLPTEHERAQILSIQIAKRGRDPKGFDLDVLAEAAEGFSGAELEAAVVAAMYRAYAAQHELGTADVSAELAATVPLARTRAEDIAALRRWADGRAVPARGATTHRAPSPA